MNGQVLFLDNLRFYFAEGEGLFMVRISWRNFNGTKLWKHNLCPIFVNMDMKLTEFTTGNYPSYFS